MITRDLWIKELAAVEQLQLDAQDPRVLTTAEFMELARCQRVTATLKLRKLVEAGKAVHTKKTIRRVDGGIQTVPAYRLLERPDAHPARGAESGRRGSRARTGRR